MPTVNPLYNFLKLNIEQSASSVLHNNTATLVTKKKKPYGLIQLNCKNQHLKIGGKSYTVSKHHISVFKDYKQFSYFSDYHYTAEIIDTNKQTFTLHVYFDHLDRSTVDLSSATAPQVKLTEGDKQLFTEVARMHSSSIMGQLRLTQSRFTSNLSRVIANKMTELFKLPQQDLNALEVCLKSVETLIPLAHNLQSLGGALEPYAMLRRYRESIGWAKADLLTASAKSPSSLIAIKNVPSTPEAVPLTAPELSLVPQPDLAKTKSTIIAKQENPAQLEEDLKQCLITLLNQQTLCKNNSLPHDVVKYHHMALDAYALLLKCQDYRVINQYVALIHEHLNTSQAQCISQLSRAFEQGEIKAMNILKSYKQLLPDYQIALVIMKNKKEQLNWLLKEGDLCPNRLRLDYNKKQLAPLAFAFAINSPECFKILLEAGTSSMVAGENDLPLAHHVFMQEKSPFRDALIEYLAKTSVKPFLKQLVVVLMANLSRADLTDQEKQKITSALPMYETMIKNCANIPVALVRQRLQFDNAFSHLLSDTIRNSPEYIAKSKELKCAVAEYAEKQPNKNRRCDQARNKEVLNHLVINKEALTKHNIVMTKKMALGFLDTRIKSIAALSAQYDVEVEIRKAQGRKYTKRIPTSVKQLYVKYNKLGKEIATLLPKPPSELNNKRVKKPQKLAGRFFSSLTNTDKVTDIKVDENNEVSMPDTSTTSTTKRMSPVSEQHSSSLEKTPEVVSQHAANFFKTAHKPIILLPSNFLSNADLRSLGLVDSKFREYFEESLEQRHKLIKLHQAIMNGAPQTVDALISP